jgi:hypothetical protein
MRRPSSFALGSAALLLAACSSDRPAAPSRVLPNGLLEADANLTPASLSLSKIGEVVGGGAGAAEITAFDPTSKRLFIVNGALGTVDVADLSDPSNPIPAGQISVAAFGAGANSVDTHDGVVAVAIENVNKQSPGVVAFYDATTLQVISSVTVGALPDMVTFDEQGRRVLVANEGEPDAHYLVDPEGSVSIIDVTDITAPSVRTATFTAFNGQADALRAQGVRIYGPNATVAQDFEPEYIAVSEDGRTAWVTLQENNALAIVDIASATVTSIAPLGYKDHSLPGNAFDASDRDGPSSGPAIRIRRWPVYGMYQPDAIASYRSGGQTYLITANEGDARDYQGSPGFQEEARVGSLPINPAIFTNDACDGPCSSNARLGRLTVTRTLGLNTATGQYDSLFVLGARSFSIWTSTGQLVWDSGDQFERRTTSLPNVNFNASNTGNALDDRSDNKGPEPEGVVTARFGGRTYAFIGLERVGGIMVYDVTNPLAPYFVTYTNTRQGAGGDLGPEGLHFVSARHSPNGKPLLIVGNEVSGTTAIFQVNLQ